MSGAASVANRPPIPPVLYVPGEVEADDGAARLDYRTTKDGRTALLAYTALDRLVECCGHAQPWVVVETSRLDDMGAEQPYDVIYLDMRIPEEFRRGAAGA